MEILIKTMRYQTTRGAEGPEHQIKKKIKKNNICVLNIFPILFECGKHKCGKRASSRSEGRAEGLWELVRQEMFTRVI